MVSYKKPLTKKEKNSNDRYIVPSVEQAAKILLCLAASNLTHMSLIDICSSLGIHKSKAYSILNTLQKYSLVQRNMDGKGYSLGSGLVTLSRRTLDKMSVHRLADPILKELARKTGGTAIFGLIAEKGVFVAAKQEGEGNIGVTIRIGTHFPITYGSHGKAIAAFLPKEKLDALLSQKNLYFHGSPEKFNRKRLEKEIKQCRKDWFAVDLGEMKQGITSIATPVFGVSGTPIGYIVIITLFPADLVLQFGPMVAEAGNRLSTQLGADLKRIGKNF